MKSVKTIGSHISRARHSLIPDLARSCLCLAGLVLVLLTVAGCGSSNPNEHSGQPYTVTLAPSVAGSNPVVQAGGTLTFLVKGLQNKLQASDLTVVFTPFGGGIAVKAAPSSITDQGSGTYQITVTIPSSITPASPAVYLVSVSGTDSSGFDFSSTSPLSLTVNPASQIVSITPASGYAGQTVSVTIVASYSNFVQGTTQASFGAGISVGGAAEGAAGPVTVSSATQAVASLAIDPQAATGARNVLVTTGPQSATGTGSFTVLAPLVAPVIQTGGPYTGVSGQAISFDGSASTDGNGSPLTFTWNFGDNSTATGAKVQHTYAAAGTYAVSLTGTDALGATATATTSAKVTAALKNPVANPGGPYTGTAGTVVAFNGSASTDPNGEALTYAWNFGDGNTGSGESPTHAYAKAGSYTVSLTVTDTSNLTATASAAVTISAASPMNPTANAGGPYTGTAGSPITFSGSGSSDPNGQALSYAWSFGDGGSGTGVSPTHTYTTAGTYTATLTVTDTSNLTATATAAVTVKAAALKNPVPNAGGPYTGTAGTAITFNGSGSSDPNGQTLTYAWNFGDGANGTGVSPAHTYTTAGSYTATLTVTDTSNLTASATAAVTVAAAPPKSPTANAGGPYSGTAGTPINFNGSASNDPNGQTLTYAWNFGDGGNGTGVSPAHTYTAAGTYTATLTVTDTSNLTASASATVTVKAAALKNPSANAGGPYTGTAGAAITFDGSNSSDPNGQTLTYAWSFGDNSTGTGVNPTHAYASAGTYNITLTVTDTSQLSASATSTATVTAAVPLITVSAGGPYTGIPNAVISFNGSQSVDGAGSSPAYAWNFGDGGTATGVQPTHSYAQAGTYTVTLTVTDGTSSASATTTSTINATVGVLISTPTQGTLTNTPTVTVTGTVANPNATVTVNGIAATVSSGAWTAQNVALREGVNLLTATAVAPDGTMGSANVSVTLDTTPPAVTIMSPSEGAKVFSPQLSVVGMVSDLVAGTINAQNVAIAVNGVPANVSNRSFSVSNVLLAPGANTVTVVATDKAGNTGQAVVHVNYQNHIVQQTILPVSGSGQAGVIGSTLPQQLVAQLVSANGQPVAGRPITFTVTLSDGQVMSLPSQGTSLTLLSDANGKAAVLFQLGSRSGVGINQVTATSPGFTGQVVFSADSTVDQPAEIRPVIGENQRGVLGQNSPKPLQVIVMDRMGNPLANVPVTFTVTGGGGSINGQTSMVQNTNSDGKATATLTLGLQEGTNNNLVTADFTGDTGPPILFQISGLSPGQASSTMVSGVVLDNTNTPISGATARIQGTNLSTTTNAQGQFSITGVPVGTQTLLVDGSTSSSTYTYPSLSFVLQALPGVNNSLDMPIYLPLIDQQSIQTVGGDQPVTLTMSGVPGVGFTVAPNSVTFPDGSHVGQMSLSQVKSDMVPMPPVNGVAAPIVWTLQPAGAKFNPPIQVTLPNISGLAPGQVTELYQFDHDLEQFVSGGTARVSPDGSVITTDPGFGIVKAGWGHNLPPTLPPSCTINCNDHSDCLQGYFVAPCACRQKAINVGGSCGDNGTNTNKCFTMGKCDKYGGCSGGMPKPGAGCNDGLFCTDNDMCQKDGSCSGTPFKGPDPVMLPEIGWDLSAPFEPFSDAISAFSTNKLKVASSVTVQRTDSETCCENPQIKPNSRKVDAYKGTIGIQGKIYAPEASFKIPNTKSQGGLYLQSTIQVSAGINNTTDKCTQGCVLGAFGVAGNEQVGWDISDLAGNKFAISGEATIADLKLQPSGDCKSATLSGSVGQLVVQADLQTGLMKIKLFKFTLVEGAPFTNIPVPLQ